MSDTETRARRNELYDSDFYAWTQEQARLLRECRWADLDLGIVESSPSLQNYVSKSLHGAYSGAMVAASEETGMAIGIFPDECPFSADEVLDFEFFPEDRPNE